MSDQVRSFVEKRYLDQYFYSPGYPPSSNSSVGTTVRLWSVTKSGTKNQKHKSQIASLQEAGTPYKRTGAKVLQVGSYSSEIAANVWVNNPPPPRLERGFFISSRGTFLGLPVWSGIGTSDAENIAMGKFLSNVGDVISPFKAPTFLGELKDTLKMLKSPAKALRRGISSYLKRARGIRRSGRTPDRSYNKVLSDTWLEYAYGWKPLISDIESAIDAYATLKANPTTLRVYGKGETKVVVDRPLTQSFIDSYRSVVVHDRDSYEAKVIYKGVVVLPIEGGGDELTIARLKNALGFKLEEFIPTAWELVPFSFVVDTFSNIGTILSSGHGLTAQYAWKSRSVRKTMRRVCNYTNPKSSATYATKNFWGCKGSEIELYDYERFPNPPLWLPRISLELPGEFLPWLNMASLVNSLRPGR